MKLDTSTPLSRLYELLRDGHALTLANAADHLDLESKRHVRRLRNKLKERGLPIRSRWRDGRKEFFLDPEEIHLEQSPVSLTERQALALVVAAEAARSTLKPTPLSKPLDQAFTNLIDRLDASAQTYDLDRLRNHWYFDSSPVTEDIEPASFDTVVRAMNEQRSIRVDYYTASTDTLREGRKIDPLHMAVTRGTWMCVGYCHLRDGIRDFALQRMSNATLCKPSEETAYFDRPDDFDPEIYFREHFGGLTGKVHVVRLLIEPDAAPYFRDRTFHPTQQIDNVREDGRLEVSFEMPGLEGTTSFVRSWGSSVTVLDPPELIARIKEDLHRLTDRYDLS